MSSPTRIGRIASVSPGSRTLRVEMTSSYVAYALSLSTLECEMKDGTLLKCRVASSKKSNDGVIVTVVPGVPRDTVAQLKKCAIVVPDVTGIRDTQRYDAKELAGLSVINGAGESVGIVEAGFETSANGMMEVFLSKGGELLLPVVPEIIDSVDWDAKRLTLQPNVPLGDDEGVQA